jgi:hypothetical protein
MSGWKNGNVNLLPLFVHRLTGKRHKTFPADQAAQSYSAGFDNPQPVSITISVNKPFRVGGNKFPLMVYKRPVIIKC